MSDDQLLRRRLERERAARQEAERILESRSDELYEANRALQQLTDTLEARVRARTAELKAARDVARDATRAKSRFLANVSHEIRTPLAAVLGYAEMLHDMIPETGPAHGHLVSLTHNAEHLYGLLGEILEFSRLEAVGVELVIRRVELSQILRPVVSTGRERAQAGGLDFVLSIDSPLPSVIHADGIRVRQILLNLVANAVKFTHEGRVVLRISCDTAAATPGISFDVEDTGPGIAPSEISRIFDPYTQIDKPPGSAAQASSGVGLGLQIARQLSELMGGRLSVRSVEGTGSSFAFFLPLTSLDLDAFLDADAFEAALTAPRKEPVDQGFLRGISVLVVDDQATNAEIFAYAMKSCGAETQHAGDGVDAIRMVAEADSMGTPYHVVLMDVRMPKIDGIEATRRIRAAGFDVPILGVTADVTSEVRAAALEAGCNDVLPKPTPRSVLIQAVARFVELSGPSEQPEVSRGLPQELVDRFHASCAEALASLRDAVEGHDEAEIRAIAHRLAGTGSSYGYPELTHVARRVDVEPGDATAVQELVAALEAMPQAS